MLFIDTELELELELEPEGLLACEQAIKASAHKQTPINFANFSDFILFSPIFLFFLFFPDVEPFGEQHI